MMLFLRPKVNYILRHSKLQSKNSCGLVTFSKATNLRTKGLRWNFDEQSNLNEIEFGRFFSSSN
jgi:hypothetical protein